MPRPFDAGREQLERQYLDVRFDAASGLSQEELAAELAQHRAAYPDEPRIMTRAWLFHLLCSHGRIAVDPEDYFADKLEHHNLLVALREEWRREAEAVEFADDQPARPGAWTLKAQALADYVHTTIEGAGPAPRIPPLRLKGGLAANSSNLDFEAEVERVTAQTRVAAFETGTPGYTMVNASVAWRPWGRHRPLSLMLSANNLFDVEARRHASLLKDYAPLPGRDIRLTVRVEI